VSTNRTKPIQSQDSPWKTTYVITRNTKTTRLVFIRLHFHVVSSRLLLGPWHSNDPEPKIYLFLLKTKPHICLASCSWWLRTFSTYHIRLTYSLQCSCELTETVEKKRFYWHNPPGRVTLHDRDGGELNSFKNRESDSEVCKCGMSTQEWPSTQIPLFERTRQSAWLDAETTPGGKKRVNSCERDNVVYWKTKRKIKNDLQCN